MRNFIIFIALLSVNLVTHGDIKGNIFNNTESIKITISTPTNTLKIAQHPEALIATNLPPLR